MGVHESDAKYYRKPWMTDAQWECALFLADLRGGFHHMRDTIKKAGDGIEYNHPHGSLATYDFDELTRAVFMAHDRCIRFEVAPSGPGLVRLYLHKRKKRDGAMYERHPTIEAALSEWRKRNPTQQEG